MKSGVLPLWNPFNSYGAPFLADIQTCVFYPFSLILYLPDYRWAFNFYILVHLAMAGTFCAVWMKDSLASDAAAFLAGLAYCLGGYVMSAISLTISLASLVYFPLALLTLRRAFASKGFFWKAMASIVLLVQYLAGDPAIFFATMVVLTVVTLSKSFENSTRGKKLELKFVFDLFKIVAVFLGLSLFHTLLFFEFLMRSNRAGMGYDQVTMWSLQYNDLLSLFFPYFSDLSIAFMGYWERQSWLENAYAGVVPIMLCFFALRGLGKDRRINYHALLMVFGLTLALGRFSLVYTLFYYGFPFFRFIRYPARFLFLCSFALACLAGFGLDRLLSGDPQKVLRGEGKRARLLAFAVLVFASLVVLTMVYSVEIESAVIAGTRRFLIRWSGGHDFGLETVTDLVVSVLVNLKRTGVLAGLFLIGVLGAVYFRTRRALLVIFFTLLTFADLIGTNLIEVRLDGEALQRPGKNLSKLLEDREIYRVIASPESVKLQYEPPGAETLELTMQALGETLTPNLLLPYRLGDVSGYDSIFTRESIAVNSERRNMKNPSECRFYDMLNVRYMVSPNEKVRGPYRLIQRAHPVNLFQNERVLPRAYLVPHAVTMSDREAILKKITSADFDPENSVYLEESPGFSDPGIRVQNPSHDDRVEITQYGANRVDMKVHSSRAQWLFFSDMHYPGWKASLNRKETKIYRANYAFRAVYVPAGESSVQWKYDPILFKIGSAVSLCTAAGLIMMGLRRRRRLLV